MRVMNGHPPHNLPPAQPLTPREQDILTCLGDGLSNREIAERLTVTLSTVKWYARQIYNKLGVNNRGEAVARAQELGLLVDGKQAIQPKHNLPVQATSFVGREDELGDLTRLLQEERIRLINITGPGGIGKSRLALAVAERILTPEGPFADGVFFVPLAPLSQGDQMVTAVAAALSFPLETGVPTQTDDQKLLDYLRRKRLLLILDNYEHLLPETGLLGTLLSAAPGVSIIVTSREKLNLQAEHLLPLSGLTYPQERGYLASAQFDSFSAFNLFIERARQARPDFAVAEQEIQTLIEICRLVEGMPLALELAAGWLDMLSTQAIAGELQQNLSLLETAASDIPARHRHIFAAFGATWQRLTPMEQTAFAGLSVFRGGFTRRAAWHVGAPEQSKAGFWRLLASLVGKSLVRYHPEQDRYDIHELVRQFGADKLAQEAALELAAQERHSAFYCHFLAERQESLHNEGQQRVLAAIGRESDNVRAAWEWAATQVQVSSLAQAMDVLGEFYEWNGRFQDGETAFVTAVSHLRGEATKLLARALIWQSIFARYRGLPEAPALLDDSLAQLERLAEKEDVRREQAFAWRIKGIVLHASDPEAAEPYLQKSLAIATDFGDQWGMGQTLTALGELFFTKGQFDKAEQLLRQSLQIQERLGDYRTAATTLELLTATATYQGKFAAAESFAHQSNNHYQRIGGRLGIANGLGRLGVTLIWLGKHVEAYQHLNDSLTIYQDLGNQERIASLHIDLAISLMHQGQYEESHRKGEEGLEMGRALGSFSVQAYACFVLGWNGVGVFRHPQARAYLTESAAIFTQIGRQNEVWWPQTLLGIDMIYEGRYAEAAEHLNRMAKITLDGRNVIPYTIAITGLALLEARTINPTQPDPAQIARIIGLTAVAQMWPGLKQSKWWQDAARPQLERVALLLSVEERTAVRAKYQRLSMWEAGARLLSA
ncbi:MAG: tetratricopeptide repeat protein [Anaerolineae bacterium]